MTEKVRKFMEQVSSDEALKAELKASVAGKEKAEMVSNILQFAKDHGYELSKEDFASDCAELGEEELEAVVGGGTCICPAYGEGTEDGLTCFCLAYGTGGVGSGIPTSQGGCECLAFGIGATRRH